MYECIQAGERSYYIQCPAKIGIYQQSESEVYLIDSGGDKDAGRRVKKILDQNGWRLKGILSTHSNADHIGGNRYLQEQTGCKVFATGIEAAFTRYPVLEPSFLYGGYPFADLRHKFLLAPASDPVGLSDPDFPQEVEVIPLPGHFFDMVGYRTPDGTVFLADCLSSEAALQKYRYTFLYDVAAYLDTLRRVAAMEAALYVPAHADATRDIRPLAARNAACVEENAAHIATVCTAPRSFEEILQQLFADDQLTMTYEQYVLVGSTVRSYLAWLKDTGVLTGTFSDNRLLWQRT